MKRKISVEQFQLSMINLLLDHLKTNGYEVSSATINCCFHGGRYFPVVEFYVPDSQAYKLYEYLTEFYFSNRRYVTID